MRIGHSTIPRMHVPALVKGNLTMLDLASLRGQWGIICCLPQLEFYEAVFLNQYHRTVKKEGAVLLCMLPFEDPFFDSHLPKIKVLSMPLLADPLRRLRRFLGLSGKSSSNRCQSFIFDPQGVVRYHLVHLFNWRGLSFLVEILKHLQDLYTQPINKLFSHPPITNGIVPEQPEETQTMSTHSLVLSGKRKAVWSNP